MKKYSDICDREGWPPGPWDNECDRAEWLHDETGARCTVRRGPLGSWCGYVGVGENHPAYNREYDKIDVEVHGGLTYGDICEPIMEDEWISYRVRRETWVTESLLYPMGDAARYLREDRKFDTSTLAGFQHYARLHSLCHPECRHALNWFGFDCAHAWDLVPGMEAMREWSRRHSILGPVPPSPFAETYRDFDFVVEEVNKLAVELFKVELTR